MNTRQGEESPTVAAGVPPRRRPERGRGFRRRVGASSGLCTVEPGRPSSSTRFGERPAGVGCPRLPAAPPPFVCLFGSAWCIDVARARGRAIFGASAECKRTRRADPHAILERSFLIPALIAFAPRAVRDSVGGGVRARAYRAAAAGWLLPAARRTASENHLARIRRAPSSAASDVSAGASRVADRVEPPRHGVERSRGGVWGPEALQCRGRS